MRPLILFLLCKCVIACGEDYQPGAGGPDMSNPIDMTAPVNSSNTKFA